MVYAYKKTVCAIFDQGAVFEFWFERLTVEEKVKTIIASVS